jgi:arsenate reductase (thioredoxin)
MRHKQRVLIVCAGDVATFYIVEGLLCHEVGNWCELFSADTQEIHVPPEAMSIMDEIGIYISRRRSRSIDEAARQEFDYVISVGANEPPFPNVSGNPQRLHWPVRAGAILAESEENRLAAFREIRDKIHGRIMILVGEIAYSTWISQAENANVASGLPNVSSFANRGRRLEYFAVCWNNLEGLVSIIARNLRRVGNARWFRPWIA